MVSLQDDQAAGLRRLFAVRHARIVTLAGARGAADSTQATLRIAREMAAAGQKVVIIDEVAAPENAASAARVAARYDLLQALNGDVKPAQLVLHLEEGLRLVPAARLARQPQALSARQQRALAEMLRGVQKGADVILINAHAPRAFTPLALAAQTGVVVTASGSSASTEAYRLIKQMRQGAPAMRLALLSLRPEAAEFAACLNLLDVIRQRLNVRAELFAVGDGEGERRRCPVLGLLHALLHGGEKNGLALTAASVRGDGDSRQFEPMVY